MNEIPIILLAAGASSRMGQSKQLLKWNTETLLEHSTNIAIKTRSGKVVVVLGANDINHQKVIQHLPVTLVSNPNWKKGMGSSLKAGLKHLLNTDPLITAVLVMVCDQPFVSSDHLNALIDEFKRSGKNIIASGYSETTGVPALFGKRLFPHMLILEDGQGAKSIIQKHDPQDTAIIDFEAGATDLDTYDDYLRHRGKAEESL